MALASLRRWSAALLLTAFLAPEAVALAGAEAGHRCACGMEAGSCCCRLETARGGDSCSLRNRGSKCAVRPAGGEVAEVLPERDRAGWIGLALREGLRFPPAVARALPTPEAAAPDVPLPAPPVPPPRPLPPL